MKKKYLFTPDAKSWNNLVRKFLNLHKRIKSGKFGSEHQKNRMSGKLQFIYKRLEKIQHRVGIKLAGSVLALMLISATASSQIYNSTGHLTCIEDKVNVGSVSDPVFADLDGDGDLDLYVGDNDGYINVFTNNGNGIFSLYGNMQADGMDIRVGEKSSPEFANLDGDSDLDLYVGSRSGNINVFTNDGAGNFLTAGYLQAIHDIDVGYEANPALFDYDGDGDLDLFVGERRGKIKIYTNEGNGNFSVAEIMKADGYDIDVGSDSSPVFADIDNDNDLDVYIGENDGLINVYTNNGNGTFSVDGFLRADGLIINVGSNASPTFADLD